MHQDLEAVPSCCIMLLLSYHNELNCPNEAVVVTVRRAFTIAQQRRVDMSRLTGLSGIIFSESRDADDVRMEQAGHEPNAEAASYILSASANASNAGLLQ